MAGCPGRVPVLAALIVFFAACGRAASTIADARPLSIAPAQYWDGNDGPWSTFGIQVGTPAQQFRVLPANGLDLTWVVDPEGCTSSDPSNCDTSRGGIYKSSSSSSWQQIGLYGLSLYEESMLGYSGNGSYGTETLTTGWPQDNLPEVKDQVIASIATKQFYMGALGLDPWPVNFTSLTNSKPSLLTSLKNESKIPSLTWAYTAGAYNYVPPIFGSLTLGGYDASRFVENKLNFSMGPDISRDLLVAVQSITTNASSSPLMSTPIFAFIDSLVPYMWLPTDACTAFEKAFNLTYNDTAGLYLLTDSQHQALLANNPTVTLKIGQSTSGESVSIEMPYWSFHLNASYPLVSQSSKYFPLQRANDSTQYTLGRVFLQNAYVIANYEYFNFSVSQAQYPDTSVAQQLITLCPRGGCSSPSSGLSKGAIAGIVVGAVVALALAAFALWFCCFRPKHEAQDGGHHGFSIWPHHGKHELGGVEQQKHEMEGDAPIPREMGGDDGHQIHLKGDHHHDTAIHELHHQDYAIHELPANEAAASELHTPTSTPKPTPSHTPAPSAGATPTPPPPLSGILPPPPLGNTGGRWWSRDKSGLR